MTKDLNLRLIKSNLSKASVEFERAHMHYDEAVTAALELLGALEDK